MNRRFRVAFWSRRSAGERSPSNRRILGQTFPILFVVALWSGGCYADPTMADVKRVKQDFLVLRFRAALTKEMSGLSDRDLFEKSCIGNRVRCNRVLRLLKEKDPKFYESLNGETGGQ